MENKVHSTAGTIIKIGELETFGNFSKQELVLDIDDGKYSQKVSFEVTGKALDSLSQFAEGQQVEVNFNLRGRDWTNKEGEVKYFNSLSVWKITDADGDLDL